MVVGVFVIGLSQISSFFAIHIFLPKVNSTVNLGYSLHGYGSLIRFNIKK